MFSVLACKNVEILSLSLENLYKMRQEFMEPYEFLFSNMMVRLRAALSLKLEALEFCK
jgi:hypothetical protein